MLIALHLLSTMKVSSKLATSSSSNPAVGETVACHAIEPRSPQGRHGGRERRGPPAAHRLRAVLAKFFRARVREGRSRVGVMGRGMGRATRRSWVSVRVRGLGLGLGVGLGVGLYLHVLLG